MFDWSIIFHKSTVFCSRVLYVVLLRSLRASLFLRGFLCLPVVAIKISSTHEFLSLFVARANGSCFSCSFCIEKIHRFDLTVNQFHLFAVIYHEGMVFFSSLKSFKCMALSDFTDYARLHDAILRFYT